MNRNILTAADVPRAGLESGTGAPSATTADDYWARLAKYVPVEIVGAYLVVNGVVEAAYQEKAGPRQIALGILVALGLVATWLFGRRVLMVVRPAQLALSTAAFAVWVFATGGFFATTGWWAPWMGTVAVVSFGVAARLVNLGPLPAAATEEG